METEQFGNRISFRNRLGLQGGRKTSRHPDQEFKGGKYTLKAVIVAYDSIETHAVLLPVCGGGDGHYLTEHAREMIAV